MAGLTQTFRCMNNELGNNAVENNVEEGENFLGNLLSKYISWWPLFVTLIVLSLAGAWLYLRYTVPIYQSVATLMVKDKEQESNVLESLNVFESKKTVENELQVLRSRGLSREVASALRLYAPVFQQNRIRSTSAYTSSPISIEVRNVDSIRPVQKVEFRYVESAQTVEIAGKSYPMLEWNETPFGVLRFLPNKNYRPSANEEPQKKPLYFNLMSLRSAGNTVLGALELSIPNKQASVITLLFKDEQPKRGEDILNELVNVYNRAAINDKSRLARNTIEFIDSRLKLVVKELDSVEQDLEAYKRKNSIVDITSQGQSFLQTIGANDQKVVDINMQLAVLNKVEEYVLGKEKGSGSIVPSSINDPLLSQLLTRLYDLEAQFEKSKLTMGENFPARVALTEQISQIKPNILENIQNQRRSLDASIQIVRDNSTQYNSFLSRLPQKEKEMLNISRQQAIKNSIYTYLLEKREETALSFYSTISDSRLLDAAETGGNPISPNKRAVWMTALIFGLALSIIIVEARGLLNRTVMSRSEIEKVTRVPIIGEIIHEPSKSSIVISEGVRSLAAEQFRQLRTSLGYLGINSDKRKLLITSCVPGEGKSFVCANLGISLALIGKKVVLIELDIRKPKLSKLFGMNQEVGITHYFIKEKTVDQIVRPTSISPNLSLISCGPIPPNPSELIVNGGLDKLLDTLQASFDYVIIDTSPVVPVTDAYLISPLVDATLFVMRYGVTPKVHLQKFDRNNKHNSLKNLAIVFNGVKSTGMGNYAYAYAYGSGYIDDTKTNKTKKRFRVKKTDD